MFSLLFFFFSPHPFPMQKKLRGGGVVKKNLMKKEKKERAEHADGADEGRTVGTHSGTDFFSYFRHKFEPASSERARTVVWPGCRGPRANEIIFYNADGRHGAGVPVPPDCGGRTKEGRSNPTPQ